MKTCQRCKSEIENTKNRFCKNCVKALKSEMENAGYLQEKPKMVNGKNRGRKCLSTTRLANSEEFNIDKEETE